MWWALAATKGNHLAPITKIGKVRIQKVDENESIAISTSASITIPTASWWYGPWTRSSIRRTVLPLDGNIIAARDLDNVFRNYPDLGERYNAPFKAWDEVKPHERLDRMIGVRFDVPDAKIARRKDIDLAPEDISGTVVDLKKMKACSSLRWRFPSAAREFRPDTELAIRLTEKVAERVNRPANRTRPRDRARGDRRRHHCAARRRRADRRSQRRESRRRQPARADPPRLHSNRYGNVSSPDLSRGGFPRQLARNRRRRRPNQRDRRLRDLRLAHRPGHRRNFRTATNTPVSRA